MAFKTQFQNMISKNSLCLPTLCLTAIPECTQSHTHSASTACDSQNETSVLSRNISALTKHQSSHTSLQLSILSSSVSPSFSSCHLIISSACHHLISLPSSHQLVIISSASSPAYNQLISSSWASSATQLTSCRTRGMRCSCSVRVRRCRGEGSGCRAWLARGARHRRADGTARALPQ